MLFQICNLEEKGDGIKILNAPEIENFLSLASGLQIRMSLNKKNSKVPFQICNLEIRGFGFVILVFILKQLQLILDLRHNFLLNYTNILQHSLLFLFLQDFRGYNLTFAP